MAKKCTIENMKKIFISLFFVFCAIGAGYSADEKFFYCGPGYVLNTKAKIDGVTTYECQKLWCRDLEASKSMGSDNAAASGYKATSAPVELCDAENNCIQCFGDRKWCAGETAGVWNPDYGAYTRGGSDNATYGSYQKAGCFSWRLEKPTCTNGETAILKNGEWVCVTSVGNQDTPHDSSIRRTNSIRRSIR